MTTAAGRDRPKVPRRSVSVLALTLLLGSPLAVSAQSGEDATAAGSREGRTAALVDGQELGRAQALMAAFLDGFEQGLEEAGGEQLRAHLLGRLREAVRQRGHADGREAGEREGEEAARDAWRREGARPERTPPPEIDPPDLGGDLNTCPPPPTIRLSLTRTHSVDLDPRGLEDRESPLARDEFDVPYPKEEDLRARARRAGASSHLVGVWVRDYQFAFHGSYQETFADMRETTPVKQLEEQRRRGLEAGRAEGERRIACGADRDSIVGTYREGFAAGRAAGWADAWQDVDDLHGTRAMVLFEDARIVDASGDGVLEPGEEALLEVDLINAGAEAVHRSAGRWVAIRGVSASGRLRGDLPPGGRRTESFALGATPPDAPDRSRIVVRLRGLGGARRMVVGQLGTPVDLRVTAAELVVVGGRLSARTSVELQARTADPPDGLSLWSDGLSEPAPDLPPGGRAVAALVREAPLPAALAAPHRVSVELRDATGRTLETAWLTVSPDLQTALGLMSELADPQPAAQGLALRLTAAWDELVREPGHAAADLESSEVGNYARLLAAVGGKARAALDATVTEALMRRARAPETPRRWRRRLLELLPEAS